MLPDDDDFHDFDPYGALVDLSELLQTLSKSHSELIDDYMDTKKRLRNAELRINMIQKQLQDSK